MPNPASGLGPNAFPTANFDLGGLFGTIGDIFGAATNPIGTAIGLAGGVFGGGNGRCQEGMVRDASGRCVRGVPEPGFGGAVARTLPGGRSGFVPAPQGGLACPSGFHLNRTNYYTQQGFVMKGTKCVKNRRRNNLNPRAANRSARRLVGFTKDVKRVEKALRKVAGPRGRR